MSITTINRNKRVKVHVTSNPPYPITDVNDKLLGTTLEEGSGIYMKDVTFTTLGGQPIITGNFLGTLEQMRLNLSEGIGVMFDETKKGFTDGDRIIAKARMVQILGGVIKIVIEDE